MAGFKKILVAIGFTPYSQGIFNFAAKIAEATGTDLLVASIINTRDVDTVSTISALGYAVDGEHYISAIREERTAQLDKIIIRSGFPRDRVHSDIIMGNPINELLKLCVTEDVEMIVMGTKGRTDLESIFIGSVAEKIFRRAPVTVVSYRDEHQAARMKKRIHFKSELK